MRRSERLRSERDPGRPGASQSQQAYRPAPGPRRGGWTGLLLGVCLGLGVGGWLVAPGGLESHAGAEATQSAHGTLWPEAPLELRLERRALRFDHMFRAERSVSSFPGATALGS